MRVSSIVAVDDDLLQKAERLVVNLCCVFKVLELSEHLIVPLCPEIGRRGLYASSAHRCEGVEAASGIASQSLAKILGHLRRQVLEVEALLGPLHLRESVPKVDSVVA